MCSACASASGGDRLPIAAAETVAIEHGFLQVIVLAWDGKQTCVASYGTTDEQSAMAAEGGNRIKRALGWPEVLCNTESVKVVALKQRLAELEQQMSGAIDLLQELRSARPLLLYGDAWIERINQVLGAELEQTRGRPRVGGAS